MWTFSKTARQSEAASRIRRVPEGQIVYAIGDIHGCLAELDAVLGRIAEDIASTPQCAPTLVLLGDYIDRGPNSAGVLERLAGSELPAPVVALRGNHEQMLERFLDNARFLDQWRQFGGLETLHSFGVPVHGIRSGEQYEEAQSLLRTRLRPDILAFLASTRTHHVLGDYFFCHAGIRPGIPLERQSEADLLWIREDFLKSNADHGKMIVHGHSPVEHAEMHPNRINIDTGAYLTGSLTCLVLEGEMRRLLA